MHLLRQSLPSDLKYSPSRLLSSLYVHYFSKHGEIAYLYFTPWFTLDFCRAFLRKAWGLCLSVCYDASWRDWEWCLVNTLITLMFFHLISKRLCEVPRGCTFRFSFYTRKDWLSEVKWLAQDLTTGGGNEVITHLFRNSQTAVPWH